MKCERINDDFLSAQEYASGGDRKNKFNNIRDEEDGEIVADMMIELRRGANSEPDRKFPSTSFSHKQMKPASPCGESWGLVEDGCMVGTCLGTEGGM